MKYFSTVLCSWIAIVLSHSTCVGIAQDQVPVESSVTLRPEASSSSLPTELPITPKDRLTQLDQTFRDNLASLHLPVVQKYLEQLISLARDHQGSPQKFAVIQKEIDEVKQWIEQKKGFPLEIIPEPSSGMVDSPKMAERVIVAASQANNGQIKEGHVLLNKATWALSNLLPGSYRVSLVYRAENLATPYQIRWNALDQSSTNQIPMIELQDNESPLRSLSLGIINILDSSPKTFEITIENLSSFGPPIQAHQVILERVHNN